MPGGEFLPPWSNPWVWAALLTGLVYRITRSFLGRHGRGHGVASSLLSKLLGR